MEENEVGDKAINKAMRSDLRKKKCPYNPKQNWV